MPKQRPHGKPNFTRKPMLVAIGIAVLVGSVASMVVNAPRVRAQSTASDWEKAAGGKMSFDVASIKQNKYGDSPAGRTTTNVGFDAGDDYRPTGGLLRASSWPVAVFISFAYKLTPSQANLLQPRLPKWAATDRFDIEAHAAGNPSKDQMRLMMQSLLADRFKLAIHFETRQLPVFAVVLVKPGKTGPQIQPYSDGPPCDLVAPPSTPNSSPNQPIKDPGWFLPCGNLGAMFIAGRVHIGERNMTMSQIAGALPVISMGTLDRPVVDQTGLTGNFDLRIEFTPPANRPQTPGSTFQPDDAGPTFLEALKEQLGLKLESQTGPVNVLVLDHIEEPSEN